MKLFISLLVFLHSILPEPSNFGSSPVHNYLFRLFSPENLPNILLVVVGIVGIFVALGTLRAIRIQTNHIATQADAERPWLFLVPYKFSLVPTNRIDWRIRNRGRTVARVTEVRMRCKKYVGLDKILALPPDYGRVVVNFYKVPIYPNGYLDAWSTVEGDEQFAGLTGSDVANIQQRGQDLVAFGSVKYIDQSGRSHESRFCYYFAVPFNEFRIYLQAPAEYHLCD